LRQHWTYLALDLFAISIPFARSFEPRVHFASKWKFLLPAILIPGALFIIWDVIFTRMGVWGFNETYLLGINILNLPIEEWLFFVCIPYACVFTYEALNYFVPKDFLAPYTKWISLGLIIGLLSIGVTHYDKLYTSITFISCAVAIAFLQYWIRPGYLSRFYFSYAVILIPFFLVNGVLTGSWIDDPVVWYNNAENLGIRLGTIPVEDTFYGMLLILLNVALFEYFQKRAIKS
jgi:lycopene cyclase domain-containing protein